MPDRLSDKELDDMADRISRRILYNLSPSDHYDDHLWIRHKRGASDRNKTSARRIAEKMIGTAATVSIIGFVSWLGGVVINTWWPK